MATPDVPSAAAPARSAVPLRPEYAKAQADAPPSAAASEGAPGASAAPAAPRTAGAAEARRVGCCGRCLSAHTSAEAGLSFWVRANVLAATRFVSVIALTAATGFFFFVGIFDFYTWVTLVQAISFLLLGICSVLAPRGKPAKALASIAIPLHQFAVTALAFELPFLVYVSAGFQYPLFMLGLAPFGLFLLDTIALGARMQFRYVYIWYPVVVLGAFIIYAVVSVVLFGLEIGIGIAAFITAIVGVVIAGLIVIAITRLTACIAGRVRRRREVENVAAPIASNV